MRLIDADKIVYSWQIDADGQEHDGVTLKSIIDKMPTIEPERRWIPVSERLPEEKTEVLVTSNGYLYIASYEVLSVGATEYWSESIEYRHITNVTAWMPLPEPYRGEA